MVVGKVRRLSNPKRKAKKKNTSTKKRKLSAKQVKIFGTKRQKAALKAKRTKANPTRKRATAKRRNVKPRAKTRVIYKTRTVVKRVKAKSNPKRRRKARKNPLQMVTLGLVNPHKKRRSKNVATKTKKRRVTRSKSRNPRRTKRRNTKVVVLARKNKHRHSTRRRSSRNPSIGGVSGSKNVAELVIGGLGGVALGKAIPGFLPAQLTSNPLFAAVAVAAVGWGVGHLVGKSLSKNVGDGVTFGAWMEAGGMLLSNFAPGLGLGAFMPASFNEPDNPVRQGQALIAARNAALAAAAVIPAKGVNGVQTAYGNAY